MKARVKATGEIVNVTHVGTKCYLYDLNNVEILNEPDYWDKLHHQAVIDFMKSFLDKYDGTVNIESLLSNAIKLSTALVNRLKEEKNE